MSGSKSRTKTASKKRWIVISLIIVAVLIVAGAYFIGRQNTEQNENIGQAQETISSVENPATNESEAETEAEAETGAEVETEPEPNSGADAETETETEPEAEGEEVHDNTEYYLNSRGILVDKVEEFEIQTFGEYTLKCPILNEGVDEVVVYEFDTYDGKHVILDASNVYQQTNLDEIGDYGDVQLEQVAPGKDIEYLSDGESYYIEDHTINLLTISKPLSE